VAVEQISTYRTPQALRGKVLPDRILRVFRDEDELPMETTLSKHAMAILASASPFGSNSLISLVLAWQVDRAPRDRNPAICRVPDYVELARLAVVDLDDGIGSGAA
jgi:hypothetical protein